MEGRRKVWQHEVAQASADQLRELVHGFGWELIEITPDYGEDFLVRIFHQGNPTGHDFYLQLKGTRDIEQYALRSGLFSYPVEFVSLRQWHRLAIPVVLVLWDIKRRVGHWVHVQSLVKQNLRSNSKWLQGQRRSKRRIRIPATQILLDTESDRLAETIHAEFASIGLARDSLETSQQHDLKGIVDDIESGQKFSSKSTTAVSPRSVKVQKQILIAQYESALALDASDAESRFRLAEVYYDINDLDKALIVVNQAWNTLPKTPKLAILRGCILAEYAIAHSGTKSILCEAIDLFESAREKTSSTASIDYNIGNCYAGFGDHESAIGHYDKALASNPPGSLAAQIWKNRGTAFFHCGNHDEEIACYKKALRINPKLWQAFASWGSAAIRSSDFQKAKALLTKCLRVNPDLEHNDYCQVYCLAYTLWKLKDLTRAYDRVKQALAIKPDLTDGLLLKTHVLSQLWRSTGKYVADAMSFFKERIMDNPGDLFARGELYLIYNRAGQKRDARLTIEDIVSLDSAPPQSLYHYAELLVDEGRDREAIRYLRRAARTSREHHIVHELARLYKKTGNTGQQSDSTKWHSMGSSMRRLFCVTSLIAINTCESTECAFAFWRQPSC